MATSLDRVDPLDLSRSREETRERPPWTDRATSAVVVSAAAAAITALALLISEDRTFGPGRVLGAVLVGVWCASAVFVAVQRPDEPLALLMACAATVGAVALFGAALAVRDAATLDANDWGAAMRAVGIGLLPAVGLHLGLGLPDGALRSTPRRAVAALGYVAAGGLAASLFHQRPDVPLVALTVTVGVCAAVTVVGCVSRYRRAVTVHDRVRLQWVAGAVAAAAALAVVAVVLRALVSWPEPVRGVAVATTVLVPLALALGASERLSVLAARRGHGERHAPGEVLYASLPSVGGAGDA